ncbi:hypothetical protein [Burkholderia ambifaria]|nr:hypothetical protein [Burkholderia ambifaria]MBY4766564.1 hypothetical protein [Burkholderia ambifaria]
MKMLSSSLIPTHRKACSKSSAPDNKRMAFITSAFLLGKINLLHGFLEVGQSKVPHIREVAGDLRDVVERLDLAGNRQRHIE